MRLVLDSNVLLSAFISDSLTRRIILKGEHRLYYPETNMQEINKYKMLVREKTGLSTNCLEELMDKIFRRVEVVNEDYFLENVAEAISIMEDIDIDDMPVLALALSIPDSIIWSNDKHLHKQKAVKAIRTGDLL